jgi:hydrogenase/urease accessory protein HupE
MFWLGIFFFLLCLLTFDVLPADAHLYLATDGGIYIDKDAEAFTLRLNMNLEAILAGIDPEVRDTSESPNAREYNRLRNLPPAELEKEFEKFRDRFVAGINFQINGQRMSPAIASTTFNDVGDLTKPRKTFVFLKGKLPADAKTFSFGWRPEFGKVLLRTAGARQRSLHVETLERGQMSQVLNIDDIKSRTIWDMIGDFVYLGYTHILPKGLDHILFVVGIFLLSIQVRPILSQVTAFTVAHTLTLGLGTAGVVNLPSSIVEPLIAASIVYVAVENILRPTLSPWRPMVVFCFGLLHGLGFAGILKEFGIPRGDFLVGLLSFNVGVELGQLTIIAICFMLVGIWFGNRTWYRAAVVVPGSLTIALIGGFWFVQRVGLIA